MPIRNADLAGLLRACPVYSREDSARVLTRLKAPGFENIFTSFASEFSSVVTAAVAFSSHRWPENTKNEQSNSNAPREHITVRPGETRDDRNGGERKKKEGSRRPRVPG